MAALPRPNRQVSKKDLERGCCGLEGGPLRRGPRRTKRTRGDKDKKKKKKSPSLLVTRDVGVPKFLVQCLYYFASWHTVHGTTDSEVVKAGGRYVIVLGIEHVISDNVIETHSLRWRNHLPKWLTFWPFFLRLATYGSCCNKLCCRGPSLFGGAYLGRPEKACRRKLKSLKIKICHAMKLGSATR